MLPLSTPGLATLAIYNSVVLWNEFVFAFVLITSPRSLPLPLAIWEYQGQYSMTFDHVGAHPLRPAADPGVYRRAGEGP